MFLAGLLMGGVLLYAALLGAGALRTTALPAWGTPAVQAPAPGGQPQAPVAAPPPESAVLPKPEDRLPPPPEIALSSPEPALWPTPQAELGVIHPPPFEPGAIPSSADYDTLRKRELGLPIAGLKTAGLLDNFAELRAGQRHEALDIPAPRGTPVLAVDSGRVAKMFISQRGGITVYQFDTAAEFCYYYAHLDRYAEGLKEGSLLKKGDVLGYVGTTGNAPPNTPHLHFAIFKVGSEKRWWQGTPINPYPILKSLMR